MGSEMVVAAGAAVVAVINGSFLLASQRSQKKTNTELAGQVGIIKNEVKNSHPTNLREDMDKQYKLLLSVAERVDKTSDDVREVRRATGKLFDLDREKAEQIKSIEKRVNTMRPCLSTPPPPTSERNSDA